MNKSLKMSLVFTALLSLLLLIILPSILMPSEIADATSELSLLDFILDTPNYSFSNSKFTINGNYTSFEKLAINSIISDTSKTHIFYNINLNDNIIKNNPVLSNNVCIYHYKNGIPCVDTFLSNEENSTLRFYEIKSFITEKIFQKTDLPTLASDNTQIFNTLYSGSMRRNEKPYGYIDIDWTVKKYRASDISSLYIVESHAAFTPGIIAKANDSSGYSNWKNISGYLHITPRRAQFDVGYGQTRYGGTPVFKDAYPLNNPGTITISSSYNIGMTIGYSFKNGFSLDNISVKQKKNIGLNISYGYNKSYTTTEPALSAQKNASNPQAYEWLYTYKTARSETNHLITGYMFEMNNAGHDLLEGDLSFRYDYKMTVKRNSSVKSFSDFHIVEYT